MSKSSNALWVGAIIIVAALTAVELMSSRDDEDDAIVSAENSATDTVAAITPAPRQTDQIVSGIIAETDEENEFVDVIDPDADFDPASFQAPDLIVDLDNPDAYIADSDDDTLQETGSAPHTAELAGQTTTMDTSITEAAQTAPETAADIRPSETHSSPDASIDTMQAIAPDLPSAGTTPSATHSVIQHLADAERAIKELRLTTPKGNNAQEHYEAILAVDPDNADARTGMQKIVDMYVYFIEKAIADDKAHTARVYLQRAELLQPGSEKLKNLRAELY